MRFSIPFAAILVLAALVMMPAPSLLALEIQPPEAFGFSFICKIVPGRPSIVTVEELQEEDFEPNDWDGSVDPFPPEGWGGDLGVLEIGTTAMYGSLRPTGFDNEIGWYTGDTDLFGFDVPEEGLLTINAQFEQECLQDQAYNIWFLAHGDMGNLYWLDLNFNYPYVDLGLICPFDVSYFIEPDYLLNPISGERAIYFYAFLAGASGPDTSYTLDLTFDNDQPCCFFREVLK